MEKQTTNERPSSGTPNKSATNNTNNEPEVLPAAPLFASDWYKSHPKPEKSHTYSIPGIYLTYTKEDDQVIFKTDQGQWKGYSSEFFDLVTRLNHGASLMNNEPEQYAL